MKDIAAACGVVSDNTGGMRDLVTYIHGRVG